MTSNEILQADMLDILFDNRNKNYGAYQLRKTYHQRMLAATGLTALLATGVLLWFVIGDDKSVVYISEDSGPVIVSIVDLEPPVDPPPAPKPPTAPAQQTAVEHYTTDISIVPDVALKAVDFPPVSALENAAIGTEQVDGPPVAGAQQHSEGTLSDVPAAPEPPAAPEIFQNNAVDQMAEFPGGAAAFSRYLSRKLAQPDGLQPGEQRTVKVQFVIEKDGSITRLSVVQSGGDALDELVFRALQKAPRWKPALHKGHAVAVIFTQPVTFIGAEE
ncbi:energy transducer TonB [Pseudocnuella soli]|uniref:energy transducer TonB n=1 Tax=Pseudocnuella soli TaxID=2502779 RepID=UPI00104D7D83|nr:energy transducer TonB [Pseudocnuella soli]